MQNILILGGGGMLGSMMCDYFSKKSEFHVAVTFRSLDDPLKSVVAQDASMYPLDVEQADYQETLESILLDFQPNYIINCIGLIKYYCNDPANSEHVLKAIQINAVFPHQLAAISGKLTQPPRIIQIATDCVYDGSQGNYTEDAFHDPIDVYGKSKSLGEVHAPHFLNLRCSIIGPELKNKFSLLEWFLGQPKGATVKGFTHHLWNGVTTLQFAQLCEQIILEDTFEILRSKNHCLHYVPNETVNKYQLLKLFKTYFNHEISIVEDNTTGQPVDRSIQSQYWDQPVSPMDETIADLVAYMEYSSLFNSANTHS